MSSSGLDLGPRLRVSNEGKEPQWAPVAASLHPLSRSSTLATNTWCRQTRCRAPGARSDAPEGPARGVGNVLHPFTLASSPERGRIEAPSPPVFGDTRFLCNQALSGARRAAGTVRAFYGALDRTLFVRRHV